MELKLGDKIWMYYGPINIIVGHIVDVSPEFSIIGLSALPYDDYKKMTSSEKAGCPVTWCEVEECSYITHVPYETIKKQDEILTFKPTGFKPLI